MIEEILPDGRRCRISAFQQPTTADGPTADAPAVRVIVRCDIDGLAPIELPLDACWAEAERLPPGLADLIIRHFLLA